MDTIISKDARKAMEISLKNHYCFRIIQPIEIPADPTYQDEWWYEPVKEDTYMPSEGKRRLEALRRAGVTISGAVIVHEAPKLLKAPNEKQGFKISLSPNIVSILGTVASLFFMLTFGIVSLFVQTILIDPALIVVLKDGTTVEVMKWYD